MLSGLEQVDLAFGKVLYRPGQRTTHVHFPNDCLISLLVGAEGNGALEVGMVGREGMVGLPLALGRPSSPVLVLVQGGGSAMRMTGKRFALELTKDGALRRQLQRGVYVAMMTAMQIAACNKSHRLPERLARWLLMMRDRLSHDEFPITQEFLARMLGVRRSGVTDAAGGLSRRGAIRYSRGYVKILDLAGLRAASCGCYEVIRKLEKSRA